MRKIKGKWLVDVSIINYWWNVNLWVSNGNFSRVWSLTWFIPIRIKKRLADNSRAQTETQMRQERK